MNARESQESNQRLKELLERHCRVLTAIVDQMEQASEGAETNSTRIMIRLYRNLVAESEAEIGKA